jgi:LmbE family N-acetylglucosaminyl deacetylase
MNRDHIIRGMRAMAEAGEIVEVPDPDENPDFGTPESEITAKVDVTAYTDVKRAAMRAHRSQISDESFFLAMPEDAFRHAFGTEWFIRAGQGPGITETDLTAGL